MKSRKSSIVLILGITLGFVFGVSVNDIFSNDKVQEGVLKFNHVLRFADKYYYKDVEADKLTEAAIDGMLDELDPHTVYLPAKKQKEEEERFDGGFEGIGIEYQILNDTITVVSPLTGGPCEALGILAGDRIVEIDDSSAIGFKNADVRRTLRGPKGSIVNVVIYRPSESKEYNYEIKRDKIPIYSVEINLMLDETTGYISVSRFAKTTASEMNSALNKLDSLGMEKLILDLRNNPGGLLQTAFTVSDLFIDGEKMIVYTKSRVEDLDMEFRASVASKYENIPLIILVNRGSASASEILAGAVQDWDRGLVIGETTFGKGLVQRVFKLSDNSAIRITTSRYYTPSGRAIQREIKDKKDYYADLHNRESIDADNLNHEIEIDSSKKVFTTNAGRKVFGGGGITPDIFMKGDTLTNYSVDLRRKNLFYKYVRKYIDQKGNLIEKEYKTLPEFELNFDVSEQIVNEFVEFAKENKIDFVESDFKIDKNFIEERIKAYIAREYWHKEGWYSILLKHDEYIHKAKNKFGELNKLTDL